MGGGIVQSFLEKFKRDQRVVIVLINTARINSPSTRTSRITFLNLVSFNGDGLVKMQVYIMPADQDIRNSTVSAFTNFMSIDTAIQR